MLTVCCDINCVELTLSLPVLGDLILFFFGYNSDVPFMYIEPIGTLLIDVHKRWQSKDCYILTHP